MLKAHDQHHGTPVYNVQPAGEPPLFIHEDREIMEPTSQGLNPYLL